MTTIHINRVFIDFLKLIHVELHVLVEGACSLASEKDSNPNLLIRVVEFVRAIRCFSFVEATTVTSALNLQRLF